MLRSYFCKAFWSTLMVSSGINTNYLLEKPSPLSKKKDASASKFGLISMLPRTNL